MEEKLLVCGQALLQHGLVLRPRKCYHFFNICLEIACLAVLIKLHGKPVLSHFHPPPVLSPSPCHHMVFATR